MRARLFSRDGAIIAAIAICGISAGLSAATSNPFISSKGTITGCVAKTGGPLSVLKTGKKCPKEQQTLSLLSQAPVLSGLSWAATRATGPAGIASTGSFGAPVFTPIATLPNLAPGSYEIVSKTSLNDGDGNSAVCKLSAGASSDISESETHSGYDSGEELTNILLAKLTVKGNAVLSCWVEPDTHTWSADNTSIVASKEVSISVKAVNS